MDMKRTYLIFDEESVQKIAAQILTGLKVIHDANLIFGDLKL